MSESLCHILDSDSAAEEVGGKAANLARVIDCGQRTPQTVVVSRRALRLFLDHHQWLERISNHIEGHAAANRQQAVEAYAALRRDFLELGPPAALQTEIVRAAAPLRDAAPCGLAVRSSAVCEDSTVASFAGVFESHLGVMDDAALIEAIKLCWASNWTPGALNYMSRVGVEPVVDGMAVMIQAVVPADASGVIYTADPMSGDPWTFVAHTTRGLSLDLMSGSGVGDRVRLDWHTGRVIDIERADQCVEHRATPDGVETIETNASRDATDDAVSASHVQAVAAAACLLDEAFGQRLDVEWALVDSELWIVQARPMVGLPAFFPVDLTPEQSRELWHPAVFTVPLRVDLPIHMKTPFYRDMSESEMWFRHQPDDIVLAVMWEEEFEVNGYLYRDTKPFRTFLDCLEGPAAYAPWLTEHEAHYRRRWDQRENEMDGMARDAAGAMAATSTAAELIPALLDVRDRFWDLVSFGWSGPQSLGWMCEGALRFWLDERDISASCESLVAGGTDSHTYRVTCALQALGRAIDEPHVRAAIEQQEMAHFIPHAIDELGDTRFLADYEALCWRMGRMPPSWLRRPAFWSTGVNDAQVVFALRNAMHGRCKRAEEIQRKAGAERERRVQAVRDKLDPSDVPVFERLLDWARYWAQALNDRHGLSIAWLWEKQLIWEVGRRLLALGAIDVTEDVLVLRREDLERFSEDNDTQALCATYRERLLEHRRNMRLTAPPALGTEPHASAAAAPAAVPDVVSTKAEDSRYLSGQGFSGGQTSGRARIVAQALDVELLETLQADDILVLLQADAFAYADWHSLLTYIAGVVSVSRPAHHLSQVARECGVPVVGHVSRAGERIAEGSALHIDGDVGTVRIVAGE